MRAPASVLRLSRIRRPRGRGPIIAGAIAIAALVSVVAAVALTRPADTTAGTGQVTLDPATKPTMSVDEFATMVRAARGVADQGAPGSKSIPYPHRANRDTASGEKARSVPRCGHADVTPSSP